MRVLIVEDEAKMAGLIRKGLKQEGIAADLAGQGEDALWMAGSTEYDAIVLDLVKPFSYAELLARLRALARRGSAERPTELHVGDLRLDPARRQAWRGEKE